MSSVEKVIEDDAGEPGGNGEVVPGSLARFSYSVGKLIGIVADAAYAGARGLREGVAVHYLRYAQEGIIFCSKKIVEPALPPERYEKLAGFKEETIGSAKHKLALWHKKAEKQAEDKPVYVVFHGVGGHWADVGVFPDEKDADGMSRHYRQEWLQAMAKTGAEVIAPHMSGQGRSQPHRTRQGESYFKQDIGLVADYLQEHKIPLNRVVIVGESMGGALATMLSAEMTSRGHPPAVLGLINSFSSLLDCVCEYLQESESYRHIDRAAVQRILKHPLDSAGRLQELDPKATRLYLAHSIEDERINFDHRRRLYQAGKARGLGISTRTIKDDFELPGATWHHIGWNPAKITEDLEASYHRQRARRTNGTANGHNNGNGNGVGR
ncbi:MAG: alpha/beta hydrolase family protein [Alphaproteobacteria bacterium]